MTRAEVAEQMRRPYVRTAVLKGLPRRAVVFKHVLRNALLPTITAIAIVVILGIVFANLIADLLYAAADPRIRYR